MKKLIGTSAALLLAALALAAVADAKLKLGSETSFTHPSPNQGYSFVCIKVTAPAGTRVKVKVRGGHVLSGRTQTKTVGLGGAVTMSFKIDDPTTYDFSVTGTSGKDKATLSDSQDVTNPPPGGPAQGDFICPSS